MEIFNLTEMTFESKTRTVLVSKLGIRPVIIMHEVFGLTSTVVEFGRMIVDAGFKVYLPVLFGSAVAKGRSLEKAIRFAQFLCVAHEFRALASNESGPWTSWLRLLLSRACSECGARGAGVIGLCLTGNFALAMAADSKVLAPVMSEPSLPFRPPDALHITPHELQTVKERIRGEGLEVRGYRFETDTICRAVRFERLKAELGDGFVASTIPATIRLHSVFTEHLRNEKGEPRHDKVREVIRFLDAKLQEA